MHTDRKLKIVADRNIPFIDTAISGLGETIYLPGDKITSEVVADADILLTRTRTRCNAALLDGSRISFIGTATIGTDHIDLDFCGARGITVANAMGCSAPAVSQYVLAAIASTLRPGETFADRTLGIIGVGHIGTVLKQWAEKMGMKVLSNDPPREEAGDTSIEYSTLDDIAEKCDVITVHTPYTTDGPHPTHHLLGDGFLSKLRRRPMVINSARGPVADTAALKRAYADGLVSALVIDCWEGEPAIDLQLLADAVFATPHIAGYSYQGKVRATSMVLTALAAYLQSHFGMDVTAADLTAGLPHVKPTPESITPEQIGYDIAADTLRLKNVAPELIPVTFESLRNNYPLRNEPGQ